MWALHDEIPSSFFLCYTPWVPIGLLKYSKKSLFFLFSKEHASSFTPNKRICKCITRKSRRSYRNKINNFPKETRAMSHCGLPTYINNILRQKKNYGNSNISPCKNRIFKKSSKKKPKSFPDILTLELISSFNTSQNLVFQKSSYKNRPIIIT